MSDVRVCGDVQPESMQLSDCVTTTTHELVAAVDEFDSALVALVKMSGLIDASAHPDVLAEMFIIGVVSATESYFRRALSALASICPLTVENVRDERLSLGAAAAYPRELLALGLLERTSFSTRGVIAAEIKRFTKFDTASHAEFAAAIETFDVVCLLRHAAAHWRGFLDSDGARRIGLVGSSATNYRLLMTTQLVQRAFAVCDHLVRLANHVLFRFTIRKWTESGVLLLDGTDDDGDRDRCGQLLAVFGSKEYCERQRIDSDILVGLLKDEMQPASQRTTEPSLCSDD